jgi:hypothetical protein
MDMNMDMQTGLQEHVAFYLTGRRPGLALEAVDGLGLRPALLAGFLDLTQLRYDFPLVLVDGGPADHGYVQPLSAVVDGVAREIARGEDGDRLAQHVLRVERRIRTAVAAGARGSLSEMWQTASVELAALADDALLQDSLERARAALTVDGQVIDCDRATPEQVFQHVWSVVQSARSKRARDDIARLILKLSDILRADTVYSEDGRNPDSLKAAVGSAHAELFDFEAMSRLLDASFSVSPLPESRRRRIEQLLATLRSQRFFAAPGGAAPYTFVFHDCVSALAAYHERMPLAVELAKAMAMAELEIDMQYSEERHDPLFAAFGADGLDAEEMARFPDSLVCVEAAQLHGAESDALMEILSAGLPMKVLVQADDILDQAGNGDAHLAVGSQARQVATMAIGLGDVYVLQATASHLYQLRERIFDGLASAGPALFSVFSGASEHAAGLPPYLIAAAAMESRAFPAFTYDPGAGVSWAARFSLDANPQLDLDWPVHRFAYEDQSYQRVETTITFTLADFVACDRRFARHFARVPRPSWNGSLVRVAERLSHDPTGMPEQIPSLMMVDPEGRLHQVIVDSRLVRATRRCRDAWHSLQELGGIHNSHAERLLAREREAWEAAAQQAVPTSAPHNGTEPMAGAGVVAAAIPVEPAADAAPAEQEPARSLDDPYVESARCTTCNECIQINGKMFAYDENRQCHIVDPDAGTYRQLVEAAESCQVAIIHPGKPRNPNEPGLDELVKRAEPFL